MSDYIMNRESLKRHCETMCERFKGVPTSGAYGEHRLVLELLKQTEWIPVSERLPGEHDWVLVTVEQNDHRYIDIMRRDKYIDAWTDSRDTYTDEITAWMPLPEPHKAESEDKE